MIKLPQPIITYPTILNYLPQRPPMVMVDCYYGVINEESYTSLHIKEDNIFLEDGIFSEMGILDFLAQSGIIQMANIRGVRKQIEKNAMGVITQFKDFKLHANATVGDTIFGKTKKVFSNSFSARLYVVAFREDVILMEGVITAMLINKD